VAVVVLASDFSFWDFFWDVLLLFAWVIWFWLLITVFSDLFRRHDTSGWAKVGWVVFVIVLPYFGVLVYLLVEHDGMAERNQKAAEASQRQFDSYVQSVAQTDPAEQITKAKALLADGTISQAEFDQLKQKALS
jgi:Phospholipase_D-nuclease N-terminal/Short C-terminal domain